ncbi:MAG: hypothetical protein WC682_04225 [Parcubacteria group bacterium]|jgi:hypothetical protein
MCDVKITITIKDADKEGWKCDGCGKITTNEPVDDEGGQYCFCTWQCALRWENKRDRD